MKKIIGLFLLGTIIYGNVNAQQQKGNRTMAWQVDLAENMNYDSSFSYARKGCIESVHLFLLWDNIESDTASFDPSVIADFLDVVNIYYPAAGTKVELQLAVMNTAVKTTPSELMAIDFDDPLMIRRFKVLLDTVFAHIPNVELAALNIGNESDIHMQANATAYDKFKVFLDSVSVYAKQHYVNLHGKDLKVGTTFTFHGLTDPATSALCQNVNSTRDVITTTYYPLDVDFSMLSPTVVNKDFGDLVALYPDTTQPIYFAECGYASSSICKSSEMQQAQFYSEVFKAWDTYSEHIKYLTVFKTNDWSHAETATIVANPAYGGIKDTVFYEYLRTLGVRTWEGSGTSKQAYETIRCELNARGWCVEASCSLTSVEETTFSNNVQLFPNPLLAGGELIIELPTDGVYLVKVLNINGQLIQSITKKGKKFTIDVANWSKGVYFLNILDENMQSETKKVVVR